MDEKYQSILLEFVRTLVQNGADVFGLERIKKIIGNDTAKTILFAKLKSEGGDGSPEALDPDTIRNILTKVTNEFSQTFGVRFAESRLEFVYGELEKKYPPDVIGSAIVLFIPPGFLESYRLHYLSKEELETKVLEKTRELQKLNEDLEAKINQRTEELQKLLAVQEQSGKLLVRRDLELTRANEKLHELDERKSEFLSVVAHQLRTPLSGIKWTLSMILNGELGPISNDQKVFIMKSYESNDRMIELVESMLHADRIDSGKFDFKPTPTQIFDLIDNVLYEVLPSAQKRGVKIKFDHRDPNIPQLNIDQEKMRAVFQNLLDNAIKYSRIGGTISIDITLDTEVVCVSIQDQGIGIPEDQRALIFSRFFRARNALKVETDGNGLGLFIVKSIIEKHGGKIWFESKENEGTTFYFTIKI